MSNSILKKQEEILGVIFLIEEIKKKLGKAFEISDEEGCQQIETQTENYGTKVSNRSIRRLLNFKSEPIISPRLMNTLVNWFTEEKHPSFSRYVKENIKEIESANFITQEELQILMDKIADHLSKKEKKIDFNTNIHISNITSGKNTSIIIDETEKRFPK